VSANQRRLGEALRAKYARVFGMRVDDVALDFIGEDNAEVYSRVDGTLPRWSLTHATVEEWNMKTGSRWKT
jgi:hypothetical protein